MGIDVYMRWKGQTEAEKEAQYTGFSLEAGDVGYLREAYHGGPYGTKVLVSEAFYEAGEVEIPAAVLRGRLPATERAVIERFRKVYKENIGSNHPAVRAYRDFVELAERKEQETGAHVSILASW